MKDKLESLNDYYVGQVLSDGRVELLEVLTEIFEAGDVVEYTNW